MPDDEAALTEAIIDLASQFGRYGYRRITALLRAQGWHVNAKRVARIWRREGLRVPARQPKRGRLWLNDGSCIRLRQQYGMYGMPGMYGGMGGMYGMPGMGMGGMSQWAPPMQ